MQLEGSVFAVTGGASGLGLASARRIVKAGGRVTLIDLPTSDGEKVAAELGDAARFAPGDVTDEDAFAVARRRRHARRLARGGPLRRG
jgi:NAD(P)-dependent dehydrogenase (short-subunit alcohol dehydrogenase family)